MAGEKSLGIVNSFILEIYSGIHKIKSCHQNSSFCINGPRDIVVLEKILSSQRVRILILPFRQGG